MKQPKLIPETTYHVYNHANGFENLFRSDDNYRYFLKKYSEYIYPVADTYAYCLMPNHLHLMIEIRKEKEILELAQLRNSAFQGFETLGGVSTFISQQFSNLFNGYSQAYNKKYSRRGSLFMPNFKKKEVTNDAYFSQLIAYIHNNPVHHGFVKEMTDWPHSSIHSYLYDGPSRINKRCLREGFKSKEGFVEFHKGIQLPARLVLD